MIYVNIEELAAHNFWITDSIPHGKDIEEHPPFKLLSLADIIADVLLGYDLCQYWRTTCTPQSWTNTSIVFD